MTYEELMELIEQVDRSSLDYVDYETQSHHVVISREVPKQYLDSEVSDLSVLAAQERTGAAVAKDDRKFTTEDSSENVLEKTGEFVESPMVGVAYLTPHPDKAPYVQVGDRVEKGDVVCIVEVMKLMNEIQAPCSGVVAEILVQNEEVVEYNQPLIRIEEV